MCEKHIGQGLAHGKFLICVAKRLVSYLSLQDFLGEVNPRTMVWRDSLWLKNCLLGLEIT